LEHPDALALTVTISPARDDVAGVVEIVTPLHGAYGHVMFANASRLPRDVLVTPGRLASRTQTENV